MLNSAVRSFFGRLPPRQFGASNLPVAALAPDILPVRPVGPVVTGAEKSRTDWPAARLSLSNTLWGNGYIVPGGEFEILRLTRPLGASSAASLLIVGVGSGGPAVAVTRNLGARVVGMESDPVLLAAARGLVVRSQLDRKVTLQAWEPNAPAFGVAGHHHCVALEPFQDGQPEPIAVALAQALKPGGQMVIAALAAAAPLNPADRTVRRWAELEQRDPSSVLTSVAVTRMLGRIGLDVRIAEDISVRHMEDALLGWRMLLRDLPATRPTSVQAAQLAREAELWLLRRRLVRDGRLRMMHWHAMSRPPSVVPSEWVN